MTLYTRGQLLALLLLLGTGGVGLAVGRWREAYPELVERAEQFDRRPAPSAPPARPPKLLDGTIDVNRATVEELTRLPGVGPGLARRIVEAREQGGPFGATDDLRRVPGLSRARLERLEPFVRFTE